MDSTMTASPIATTLHGYTAALDHAARHDETRSGRIWVRGRDRASLLHRLSTNDIEHLRPEQGRRTVFTTAIGRIIDVVTVYAVADALLLITSPDQGGLLFGLLRKNIFFQDHVTIEPAGRSHGQLAVYGPAAVAVVRDALGVDLNGMDLHELRAGANGVLAARILPIGGDGVRLVVPVVQLDAVNAALHTAGAALLDDAASDVLRVEHGYGAWGRELSEAYIPLETGLADAISFTKGCYVGQEIIARMESRNRLAKQLRGLHLSALPATQPLVGGLRRPDGKEAGDLTSAVVSPRYGPIALGYVRSAYAEPGGELQIGTDHTARVVALPFAV